MYWWYQKTSGNIYCFITMDPTNNSLDPLNDPSLTEKQKARIIRIRAERAAKKEAEREAEKEAKMALPTASDLPIPVPKALVTGLPKALSEALVTSLTKDIIMSVAIFGHGCEDYDKPLTSDLADYYRNNVRVYSRACVPGIISIGNILQNEDIISDVRSRFSREFIGGTEFIHGTDHVINKYITETKPEYLDRVRGFHEGIREKTDAKAAKAADDRQRSSGLSTFIFEKEFGFYEDRPGEKLSSLPIPVQQKYPTLGVHVVNVSVKITNDDGSVHYEPLFDPSNRRLDFTMFNLIYKDGLKQLLHELGQKTLVKEAHKCLGFTGSKPRVSTLSLSQLYDFFRLLGVRYVNIMDYTCRTCAVNMNQSILENFYRIEQEHVGVKRGLFGGKKPTAKKRSSKKKLDTKKLDTKKLDTKKHGTKKLRK